MNQRSLLLNGFNTQSFVIAFTGFKCILFIEPYSFKISNYFIKSFIFILIFHRGVFKFRL